MLVTGGTRSGKSTFAERYAANSGESVVYIATAQIFDKEMDRRVRLHRERRPAVWQTLEAPYDAHNAMAKAVAAASVVLFDCLTLYISNLLLGPDAPGQGADRTNYVMDQIEKLLACARSDKSTVIFVTNEVGMGIVPENALAREYRDLAGMVNQKVAAAAAEVYLVVSGLAIEIKKLAVPLGKEG